MTPAMLIDQYMIDPGVLLKQFSDRRFHQQGNVGVGKGRSNRGERRFVHHRIADPIRPTNQNSPSATEV
jgi:hypothetical protein